MKDLTEAQLIDMQNRAIVLMDALDVDLETSLKIADIREIWDAAEALAGKVSNDVDTLCDFVRAIHERCGTVEGECPRYDDVAELDEVDPLVAASLIKVHSK